MFMAIVAVAFNVYLLALSVTGQIHPIVIYLYLTVSCLTCVVYYIDKHAARRSGWRVQESTLHMMALLGGWPGAYVAQRIMRHKTMKESFQRVFVASVVLNILGFYFLLIA